MRKVLITMIVAILFCSGCSSNNSKETDDNKYQKAITLFENGDFEAAKELFIKVNGYENSDKYIKKCTVMDSIQGDYVYADTGKVEFTIDKFNVLNWDKEVTTIEINDNTDSIIFKTPKSEDKMDVSISNNEVKLSIVVKIVKLEYIKLKK